MRFVIPLFIAGALWGGEDTSPRLLSFQLNETPAALSAAFRQNPVVVNQPAFRVLQFHDVNMPASHDCDGDFEWQFFYSADGVLESITWNTAKPMSAAELFPPDGRRVISASRSKATVYLRDLPGDRVLLAYVLSPVQKEVKQAVLIRSSSLTYFFPWLASELRASQAKLDKIKPSN